MPQDRDPAPPSPEASSAGGGSRHPGRRLVLGGIPVAVTLASRPALAWEGGECSVSSALSGNLSHPLPSDVNCGMTPATWAALAGTNQLWSRTAMFPSTNFTSACGAPGFGSDWECGTQSLLAALQGGLVIECKIKGTEAKLNAELFGEQVAAGLLNAAAFAPNNYPETLAQVQQLASAIWMSKPSSKDQAQDALDSVTAHLASLNVNS